MDEDGWASALSRLDPHDVYGKILQLPGMIRQSIQIVSEFDMPVIGKPDAFVCCGMGGSAIGLDLVKSWLFEEATAPIEVIKDYRLPGYASPNTVAYVVSYSGNTEETMSCLRDAVERKVKVLSVSSGGEVEAFSADHRIPHIKVPGGLLPRNALPYLFIPLVSLLEENNVVASQRLKEIEDGAHVVERALSNLKMEVPRERNEAKALALSLLNRFPTIYAYGLLGSVGLRFKQQLNENSKVLASSNSFPELDHNELEADRFLEGHQPVVVLLRSRFETDSVRRRIDASRHILESEGRTVIEVGAQAETAISEALSLIAKLDMTSLCLALLNGADPFPTPRIGALKELIGAGV